jgi:hypothetical protein
MYSSSTIVHLKTQLEIGEVSQKESVCKNAFKAVVLAPDR